MDSEPGSLIGRFRSRYVLKLATIAALLTLVVGGVGAATVVQANDTIRGNTQQQLGNLSDLQARDVGQWATEMERETERLSSRLGETDADVGAYLGRQTRSMNSIGDEVVAVHYVRPPSDGDVAVVNSSVFDPEFEDPGELGWASAVPSNPRAVNVTDPYDSPVVAGDDEDAIAFVTRVFARDRAVVVVVDVRRATRQLIGAPGDGGRAIVTDRDGTILLSTDASLVGQQFSTVGDGAEQLTGIEESGSRSSTYLDGLSLGGERQATGATLLVARGWTVAAMQPTSAAFTLATSIQTMILLLLGVVLLAFVVLFVIISRGAISDVQDLSRKATIVAEDYEADVDLDTDRTDEIGQLVRAVDEMQHSLNEQITDRIEELEQLNDQMASAVDEQSEVMDACAEGNLSRRMDPDTGVDQLDDLARSFNSMMDDIQASIQEALSFSHTVAAESERAAAAAQESKQASQLVSEATQEISQGTDRQSEELETTVQEMSSFSASIEEVASSAHQLSARSNDAADTADEGREAAQQAVSQLETIERETDQVVQSFEALQNEAREIEEIVDFIGDLAEQTNMLALNANIEASRAGSGEGDEEGFGVVAQEIKELANDTQEAASDIESRLTAIQDRTEETSSNIYDAQSSIQEGTETIEDALAALNSIAEAVEDVDVSVQAIDDVVEDQSETAQQVVTRVEEVSDIADRNAEQAENVAAAAEEQTVTVDEISSTVDDLSEQATQLADLLGQFAIAEGSEEESRQVVG